MRRPSTTVTKKPICPSSQDLTAIIAAVAEDYTEKFAHRGIMLELDIPHEVSGWMDPILMRDAFRKLIDNAVEAMPQGGGLVITSFSTGKNLIIEFADTGPGISDELRQRLFEPFATTKHDHAGLGLCIVRDIVQAHQGTVSVMNCPEGGTAFTIQLPQLSEQRMAA